MDINIRPPDVDTTANTINNSVSGAKQDVMNAFAPSIEAATTNPGWQCSPTLTACAATWQAHLADLVDQTQNAAQRLYDSADHYRTVEARVAQALLDLRPS